MMHRVTAVQDYILISFILQYRGQLKRESGKSLPSLDEEGEEGDEGEDEDPTGAKKGCKQKRIYGKTLCFC